jgi:hypothetical protein
MINGIELTQVAVWLSAVLVSGGLVFSRHGWRIVRHGATLTHELGHTVFALFTMARVSGIRLDADSSGNTHTVRAVRIFPVGAIISSFFGYPAPLIFGSVFLTLLVCGYPMEALCTILGAGVLTLVFIRNLFGLLVTGIWVISSGAVLLFAPWLAPWYVLWTGSLLLFAGWKDLYQLFGVYRNSVDGGTDLHSLQNSSHIHPLFWYVLMILVAVPVTAFPVYAMATGLRLFG